MPIMDPAITTSRHFHSLRGELAFGAPDPRFFKNTSPLRPNQPQFFPPRSSQRGDFSQVVREDRKPHPALEAFQAAPQAAAQSKAAKQRGQAALDPRPETQKLLEPALLLQARPRRVPPPRLGNGDPLDQKGRGRRQLFVGRGVEAPVGREVARAVAELGQMLLEHGLKERAVIGIARAHLILQDQAGGPGRHHQLVPELGRALALAPPDDVRVRLENRDDLFRNRDLLLLLHPPFALPHNLLGQRQVFIELGAEKTRARLLLETPPRRFQRRPADPGHPDHLARELEQDQAATPARPLRVLALGHDHPIAELLGPPRPVVIFKPRATFLLRRLHQPVQDPRAVLEQGGVGGVMDVGLNHRGVPPQLHAGLDFFFNGVRHQQLVDAGKGLGPDSLDRLLEVGEVGDLAGEEAGELAEVVGVRDPVRQLAIRVTLDLIDDRAPQNLLHGHAPGPGPRQADPKVLRHRLQHLRVLVQRRAHLRKLPVLRKIFSQGLKIVVLNGHLRLEFFPHFSPPSPLNTTITADYLITYSSTSCSKRQAKNAYMILFLLIFYQRTTGTK
jgi:hypothetical protein